MKSAPDNRHYKEKKRNRDTIGLAVGRHVVA